MEVKEALQIVYKFIHDSQSYRGVGQDQVVRCAIETLIGNGNCANGRISMAEYALLIADHTGLKIEEPSVPVLSLVPEKRPLFPNVLKPGFTNVSNPPADEIA